MAQIITDDFNRVDAATLGANWTNSHGTGLGIVSNQASSKGNSGASADCAVYSGAGWTGGNDQYGEAVIITKPSACDAGPIVRGATGAETFYEFEINDNDAAVALGSSMRCGLYKVSASTYTLLGSASSFTVSSGDTLRVEAQGTSITAKLNGVVKFGPTTDSGIASGKPGIACFGTTAKVLIISQQAILRVSTNADAPLLRPATMGFRTGLGGLIVGKFQQRVYPQLNSVTIASISGSAIATARHLAH
jgi:hypothetical protein